MSEILNNLSLNQRIDRILGRNIPAIGNVSSEGIGVIRELEHRLELAEWFIKSQGYRKCDIAACNCPYWHGGNAGERLREIHELLDEAGLNPYQKTAIVVIKELLEGE